MALKHSLDALGVTMVRDLEAVDPSTPPPFSFEKDLELPSPRIVTYKSPNHDTYSYFSPGGP